MKHVTTLLLILTMLAYETKGQCKEAPSSFEIAHSRAKWVYRGDALPSFATVPKPGERSVWLFHRPPRIETVPEQVSVSYKGKLIAISNITLRVCETAGSPVYYIPYTDINEKYLTLVPNKCSYCEWKGRASYFRVNVSGDDLGDIAFSYEYPNSGYTPIAGHVGFYAGVLECKVGSEIVTPQPGGVYAGWTTSDLVGPIKGTPGVVDEKYCNC
eukprot:TRINITY_DN10156_c0_g1_i1.p1 TRINITY_DN10156_c0_g1~~TRINITY_DN10156_c0_g1_i1.p1  ORF type:complete len:214 (-),score=34.02 TRINITY_DN10156_c0_g1_i1:107-748(-)